MIEESLHIITDPGHLLAELTFFLVEVGVGSLIASPFISKWIKRHDKEHHAG